MDHLDGYLVCEHVGNVDRELTKARINGGSDMGSRGTSTATAPIWGC